MQNLLRLDLTLVEEAEALDRLQKDLKYQQNDLARTLGKSTASISGTLSLNRLPKEVRDECRKDASIPKCALIEIAAKNQERSMLAAYVKYKAKMNPKMKTKTGAKMNKAQSTFNVMDNAERKIQTLTPEEKQNFTIALRNIKQTAEAALALAM